MTNKELITEVREEQKRMAKEFMDLAMNLSIFMNKQDKFNQRVSDILDDDESSLRKGIVSDIIETKERVDKLETNNKVTAGKVAIGITLVSALGGFILKLLGIFDK